MRNELGILHKWDLRWRLDYTDGRRIVGVWMLHNDKDNATKASAQPREGLLKATIEGREVGTNQAIELLSCDAPHYVGFCWEAGMGYAPSTRGVSKGGSVIGLSIQGWHHKVSVFIDGSSRVSDATKKDLMRFAPPILER